jgi:hypothetical protein
MSGAVVAATPHLFRPTCAMANPDFLLRSIRQNRVCGFLRRNKYLSGKHWLTREINRRSLHCATPDFLWNFVASANFMRLSLRRGAFAVLSSAAWQEIRVRCGRDDKFVAKTELSQRIVAFKIDLSSRPKRSEVEGPAVLPAWYPTRFIHPRVGKAGGQLHGKPHEARQRHQPPQEIRGTWGTHRHPQDSLGGPRF